MKTPTTMMVPVRFAGPGEKRVLQAEAADPSQPMFTAGRALHLAPSSAPLAMLAADEATLLATLRLAFPGTYVEAS